MKYASPAIAKKFHKKANPIEGFHKDTNPIEGFSAKCEKCGSSNVEIVYEFTYYGGLSGFDLTFAVQCDVCENRVDLTL